MKAKVIARAAIMTALLIVLQLVTKSLGQFVTGTCVNFVLASTVLLCGIRGGVFTAAASPFFAFLLGIGPAFLPVVPAICLGNLMLVYILHLIIRDRLTVLGPARRICAASAAAAAKFALLFLLVTKMILPFLALSEKQSAALSTAFSWPQLVTAFIGCSMAVMVCPRIVNAVNT